MNADHRDNIGTHPAYSHDPETRLRARLEAAQRNRERAEIDLQLAQANLDAFLLRQGIATEEVPC